MGRFLKCFWVVLLCFLIPAAFLSRAAAEEEPELTLMIYISGSDLESESSAATIDIREMLQSGADLSKVNILLCTGGAKRWHGGFSSTQVCFYQVAGTRPRLLESLDLVSMGDPDTLRTFLNYSAAHFPASRYALILWDHGSGPMNGVCFDELFTSDGFYDSLSLSELETAVAGSPFSEENPLEWIGFDACLMSSVETAHICSSFARYMIASQETEPGSGWNYDFLKYVSEDLTGDAIGERIIESYLRTKESDRYMLTLSCIDLSEIRHIESAMNQLFSGLDTILTSESFSEIANGRREAKCFGRASTGSDYDLVDLYSLSEQYSSLFPEKAAALQSALKRAIVHNSGNQENSHGLSVYYPYYNKDYYNRFWKQQYESWKFATEYYQFMLDYASLWLGDPLADWSGLRAAALRPLPEGQELTMQLTPEQQASFASAELLVMMESSLDMPDYYKIWEAQPVQMSADGMLHATYSYQALYAVDPDGNLLTDAISYKIIDGVYFIRATLADKDYETYHSERLNSIFLGTPEPQIRLHKVYLQCVPGEKSDELEITGIVDLGDDPAGMLAEMESSMNLGKQTLSLEDEEFEWIWFLGYPRRLRLDDEGKLLPYTQWPNPNETEISMRYDTMENRQPWTLKFCGQQVTGLNLCAQFIVHDTQENLAASNLIYIENPNRTCVFTGNQQLCEQGGWTVRMKEIDIAETWSNPGLCIRLEIQNDETDLTNERVYADHLVFNQYYSDRLYSLHHSADAEGRYEFVLQIPPSGFPDQLETLLNSVRFELILPDAEETRIPVSIDREIDISAIHPSAAEPLYPEETIRNGIRYQIASVEMDSENLVIRLLADNQSAEDANLFWLGTSVLINDCEWESALSPPAGMLLPSGGWTILKFSLRMNSMGDGIETLNPARIPQYRYLQHWNSDAVRSIRLLKDSEEWIRVELDPALPEECPAEDPETAAYTFSEETPVYLSEDIDLSVRGIRADRENRVIYVFMSAKNHRNETVDLIPRAGRVNGTDAALRAGPSYYPELGFFTLEAEAGTDFLCVLPYPEELPEDQLLESISLRFDYRLQDGSLCSCSAAEIRFIRPIAAGETEWLELKSSDLLTEPARKTEEAEQD